MRGPLGRVRADTPTPTRGGRRERPYKPSRGGSSMARTAGRRRARRYHRRQMAGSGETSAPGALHCYRHPDRETLLSCSNCERPICTSCMTQAAVGMRCPECAGRGGRTKVVRPVTRMRAATGAPIATYVLIAVNVLVFLGELAQGVGFSGGLGGSDIVRNGALLGPAVADGDWWRLVSGGLPPRQRDPPRLQHVPAVDPGRRLRALRRAVAHAGRVLLGAPVGLGRRPAPEPRLHTVGASGAVFGLMAALYLLERQRGVALLGGLGGRPAGREPGVHVRDPRDLHRRPHRGHPRRGGRGLRCSRASAGATWPTADRAAGLGGGGGLMAGAVVLSLLIV